VFMDDIFSLLCTFSISLDEVGLMASSSSNCAFFLPDEDFNSLIQMRRPSDVSTNERRRCLAGKIPRFSLVVTGVWNRTVSEGRRIRWLRKCQWISSILYNAESYLPICIYPVCLG
jgi:hypothetical protein